MTIQRYILAAVFAVGTGVVTTGQSGAGGDWPQWQGPDRTGLSKETGLLQAMAARRVRRSSGRRRASAAATARWRSRAIASSCRARRTAEHRVRAEPRRRQRRCGRRALGPAGSNDQGIRAARHADGRRRPALRADRERRPGVPEAPTAPRSGSATSCKDFGGRNISWLISESPLVDGNNVIVTPGGRKRRHGRARQDDRQDGLDEQGAERRGGLRVADRRRRAGRAHAHDAHGERRRRRARRRRQADVALRATRPTTPPTSRRRSSSTTKSSTRRRTAPARALLGLTRAERRGQAPARSTSRGT